MSVTQRAATDGAAGSEHPLSQAVAGFPSRAHLFLLFASYFGVQVVSRTLLSSSAHLDEAEQLLLTQQWHWGYGSQPPLYTWIQSGFFALFGPSILALALFKNLLLFCQFAFAYEGACRITRSHACGLAAAASLCFIPQVIWESQRDLSHTVLASTMTLGTLLAFLRLVQRRHAGSYLLFGLCVGLACLSKYNSILLVLALLAAAWTVKEVRAAVLDRRVWLAGVAALALVLPNGWWILHHVDLAFGSASKLHLEPNLAWWRAACVGLGNLLLSVALVIGPMLLAQANIFWRARGVTAMPEPIPGLGSLLRRALCLVVALVAVFMLGIRATHFSGRWLQPLLILAPVVAAVALQPRLDPRRLRWLMALGATVAVAAAAALPARIVFAERMRREEPLHKPYDALARALQPELDAATVVVADSSLLAGNLHLTMPKQVLVTPEIFPLFAPGQKRFVLVWDATRSPEMPEKLREFARKHPLAKKVETETHFVSATYKYHRAKQARWGFVSIN
jgi:lipopolysaccharide core galacturonosyltransferase RgtB